MFEEIANYTPEQMDQLALMLSQQMDPAPIWQKFSDPNFANSGLVPGVPNENPPFGQNNNMAEFVFGGPPAPPQRPLLDTGKTGDASEVLPPVSTPQPATTGPYNGYPMPYQTPLAPPTPPPVQSNTTNVKSGGMDANTLALLAKMAQRPEQRYAPAVSPPSARASFQYQPATPFQLPAGRDIASLAQLILGGRASGRR